MNLTDAEKQELQRFADNPVMFEAVKKVLFSEVDLNEVDLGVPNAELGELVRGMRKGSEYLERGFKSIYAFREPPKPSPKVIPR